MSKLKEDLNLNVSKTAVLADVGNGVFIKKFGDKSSSAYDRYYFLHPDEKKGNLNKPIKEEVIDFIVDSMEIDLGEYQKVCQEKLRNGLKILNKKSPIARKLIVQLYHGQKIELPKQRKSAAAGFVLPGKRTIFFKKETFLDQSERKFATILLHETGHLIEQAELMPLGESGVFYCNKYGCPIHIEKNLSVADEFTFDRLCEAEKKVFDDLIEADFISSFGYVRDIFCLWFKNTKFFNCCMSFLNLENSYDDEKYWKEHPKLNLIYIKTRTFSSKIKHFLKNPLVIFSKEKREEYQQKVLNEVITSRIKELIWPKDELNQLKKNKKSSVFVSVIKKLIQSKRNKIFVGAFLCAALFQFSGGFYNQFWCKKLIIDLASFVLGGFGICYVKSALINTFNHIKFAASNHRDVWADMYNYQARKNTLAFSRQRRVNKNKSNLFIQAFCDKYQQAITPEDIKKSRTDDGEFERINRKKRCVTALDRKIESDLFELNYMIFQSKDKSSNRYENIYYEMEDMLFAARKIYLEQKKKVPFQQVMEDYLIKEIKEGKVFDEIAKHLEIKEVRFIKTPALKKALCQKLLRSRLKEIKDKRADLSYLQKQYFKLLLRGNQAKERE